LAAGAVAIVGVETSAAWPRWSGGKKIMTEWVLSNFEVEVGGN
jgi:hypothetical protein